MEEQDEKSLESSQKAKAHLSALGVTEPTLAPFDQSKFEPMPEVEIELPVNDESKEP